MTITRERHDGVARAEAPGHRFPLAPRSLPLLLHPAAHRPVGQQPAQAKRRTSGQRKNQRQHNQGCSDDHCGPGRRCSP